MQDKKDSLKEAIINSVISFITTTISAPFIYYMCDVKVNTSQNLVIVILFTLISVIRSYIVRRLFNKK